MPVAGRDARVAAADWEEEGTKAAVQETLASPHPHPPKNFPHTQKNLPTHPKTYPHTPKNLPTHPKKNLPTHPKKLTHLKNASHNNADQTKKIQQMKYVHIITKKKANKVHSGP